MLWENRYHRHPHRRCYYCPSLDVRCWHRRQRLAATEQMAKMNSRIPPSFFCNASIPERFSESYYQYHQGMAHKRSRSNISTGKAKTGHRSTSPHGEPIGGLSVCPFFYALAFESHQFIKTTGCISKMSTVAGKN